MKTRLKRGAIGAMLALLVFGAGAFAQQSSEVPVTVGVVTGERTLQVTGSNGVDQVGGPVMLAFGNTATAAPFGVVVADALYERSGYHVYSELSDLFPLADGGGVTCDGGSIPSSAFKVDGVDQLVTTGIDGVFETFLDFEDDISDNLTGTIEALLDPLGDGIDPILIQVEDVPGLIERVREQFSSTTVIDALDDLTFMDRQGPAVAEAQFAAADAHPGCPGTGSGSPSRAYLQHAAAAAPDATGVTTLTNAIFDDAAATVDMLVSEAVAAGLLPPGSDEPSGALYDATASAIEDALLDLGVSASILDPVLGSITDDVIDDLVAQAADLTLSLVGQTGVYPSVQTLNLDRDLMGAPTTGTYHGVMTVTMIDDPDNDMNPDTP